MEKCFPQLYKNILATEFTGKSIFFGKMILTTTFITQICFICTDWARNASISDEQLLSVFWPHTHFSGAIGKNMTDGHGPLLSLRTQ